MKTNWKNDWGTYTKGQKFTYDYTDSKGKLRTVTDKIQYVVQNKYYSVFVLENNYEYVLYSKLYLKLNNNNKGV
tara:strand:+ start:2047 stop:2268 length:222 start_codon:yes stop_codon:yes gene_type:complete